MWHDEWMEGHMMFGWWGVLIMFILVVAVAVIIFRSSGQAQTTSGPQANSALDVLRRRYAEGEISREEFEEKKRDLEA